jgi:phosphotransacetylase
MALWQTGFMMVPKDELHSNNNIECVDISSLWSGYNIKKESIDEVEKILKRTKGWSEDIVQLGDVSGTVIEIFYAENMIDEVTCRLDLRNINTKIIDSILNFMSTNNVAIIADNKVYLEPNRESILEIIKKSDAYRFIENPQKFLEGI